MKNWLGLVIAVRYLYAAGKMVFTVLAAVAERERSLIVKRVEAGFGMHEPRASGSAYPIRP